MRTAARVTAAIAGILLLAAAGGRAARTAAGEGPPATGVAAWRAIELPSGRTLVESRPEQLTRPVQPGSLMKLPALVAALESGVVRAGTRIPCTREITVDGRRLRCQHPAVSRPVSPADAVSLSCNVFFATIGRRLSRARLDSALARLGLPPAPPAIPTAVAATGFEAAPVTAERLLSAFARFATGEATRRLDPGARRAIVDGLRGAALFGTASAFADRKVDALAKTGTADAPGGGVQGLVVAAWPATAPTRAIVVLAPGGAGSDAAAIAAGIAAQPVASGAGERGVVVRVGTAAAGERLEVASLALEEYVAQVVAGEAAPKSAPAALEAMAIAARTFALANLGRHRRDGYDLCTLTHCQVVRPPYAAARAATEATAGRVLADGRTPADIYYTASCGGRTEVPSAVWPGARDPAHLPSRGDPACDGEPRWQAEIEARDLERALAAAGFRGDRLRNLRIAGRTKSGRVARLEVRGFAPGSISGQDLRTVVGRVLGWQHIKSTAFDLRRTGRGYRFTGRGFGHGVGMCVLGASRRAAGGASTDALLRAYYPGLTLRTIADVRLPEARDVAVAAAPAPPPAPAAVTAAARSPAVVLQLPAMLEREREALAAAVDAMAADLARATGRPLPDGVRLVVHPSVASFGRATGLPWWNAARTAGRRIDVIPVDVLRQRGTLDATLRHELAHVLTDPVLADRPVWVREGVAMHFARQPPPQVLMDRRDAPACPKDDELLRAVSAAASREAYGRAAACVARALASGASWQDLR